MSSPTRWKHSKTYQIASTCPNAPNSSNVTSLNDLFYIQHERLFSTTKAAASFGCHRSGWTSLVAQSQNNLEFVVCFLPGMHAPNSYDCGDRFASKYLICRPITAKLVRHGRTDKPFTRICGCGIAAGRGRTLELSSRTSWRWQSDDTFPPKKSEKVGVVVIFWLLNRL